MIFTVPNLSKEQRAELLVKMEAWKASTKLSFPRIYSIKPQGRKVAIEFANGDGVKVSKMIKDAGFDIE